MMSLTEWADRWGVPPAALDDLARSVIYAPADADADYSESRVQRDVRLEAAAKGVYLFRNNNGAGKMESGNFVRFGLANDSAPLSKVLKSGDLIGWQRRLITLSMVGRVIAQFTSREIKRSDWSFRGTMEEHAQVRWATLVNSQGGDAQIVKGTGSLI